MQKYNSNISCYFSKWYQSYFKMPVCITPLSYLNWKSFSCSQTDKIAFILVLHDAKVVNVFKYAFFISFYFKSKSIWFHAINQSLFFGKWKSWSRVIPTSLASHSGHFSCIQHYFYLCVCKMHKTFVLLCFEVLDKIFLLCSKFTAWCAF